MAENVESSSRPFLETAAVGSLLLAMVTTPLVTARFPQDPYFLLTLKATAAAVLLLPGAAVWILGSPTLHKARKGDGILAAWLAIGALATTGSFAWAPAEARLVEMATLAAACFIASRAGDRALLRTCFSGALFAVAVLVALYSLGQHRGWNPLGFVAEGDDQASATFVNRNLLAGFLAFAIPIGLEHARSAPRRSLRVAALLATTVLVRALFDAITRGAIIGAFTAFVAWLVAAPRVADGRRQRYTVLLPWAIAIASVFLVPMQSPQPLTRTGKSVRERLVFWHVALDMAIDRPLLGWGPGNYELGASTYRAPWLKLPENRAMNAHFTFAHNDLLQLSAEMGLPGAVLWLALAATLLRRGWAARRARDAMGVAIAAGALAVLVHGAVHYTLHDPTTSLLFFAALGTIAPAAPTGPPLRPIAQKAVKLGVLVCATVALLHSMAALASRSLFEQARASAASGHAREALWRLQAAHELDPSLLQAVGERSNLLAEQAFNSDALQVYKEAGGAARYDELSLANQGLLCERLGSLASARSFLSQAIELNPNLLEAYQALARVERADGHPDRAEELLKEAAVIEKARGEAK